MQSNRAKLVVGAAIVAVVFAFVMTVTRGERSRDLVLQIEPFDHSDEITVYVGGAVNEPGLFALPRGARLAEALELAGVLDSADTTELPLARILEDEQSIIVPDSIADPSPGPDSSSQPGHSGSPPLININQATESELQQLPGIGPALAERILDRREVRGPFTALEELSEISGISDRMIDELRSYATVEH